MLLRALSAVTAVFLAFGTVAPAGAAPVTFDFRNPPVIVGATFLSETKEGLTVTARGTAPLVDLVSRNLNGLGVAGAPAALAVGLGETLTLTFSLPVKLSSVLFTQLDANDDARIFGGSTQLAQTDLGTGPTFLFTSNMTSDAMNFVGTTISFTTLPFGQGGLRDSFRIGTITVSAIPLPLTGVLLLGGLGALAFAARLKVAA